MQQGDEGELRKYRDCYGHILEMTNITTNTTKCFTEDRQVAQLAHKIEILMQKHHVCLTAVLHARSIIDHIVTLCYAKYRDYLQSSGEQFVDQSNFATAYVFKWISATEVRTHTLLHFTLSRKRKLCSERSRKNITTSKMTQKWSWPS